MTLIAKTDHGYNQKYIRPLFRRPFDFTGWRGRIIATKIKTDEYYQKLMNTLFGKKPENNS